VHFPLKALNAVSPDSGKGGLGIGAVIGKLPQVAYAKLRGKFTHG